MSNHSHRRASAPSPQTAGPTGLEPAGGEYGNAFEAQRLFGQAAGQGGSAIPFLAEMEASFGEDFRDVRAVTGAALGDLGASAAASGDRVAFETANPDRELVAHELAHVVQQRAGSGSGGPTEKGDGAERNAEQVARAVISGRPLPEIARSSASVAGNWDDWWMDEEPAPVAAPAAKVLQGATAKVEEALALDVYDQVSDLPSDQQAEAIAKLDPKSFALLSGKLPADQRDLMLEPLMEATTDPARKAELWKEYHKSHATQEIGAKLAGLDTSTSEGKAEAEALKRTLAGELAEAEEEAKHFAADPNADFRAMRDRKDKELEIEVRNGINLTNDGDDAIAAMGGKPRTRSVWSEKELDWFDKELPKIPAEHRHQVTEFRRADKEYKKDAAGVWQPSTPLAQHFGDTGRIEMFDSSFGSPGALVHEIGHNVDKNHGDLRAKYDEAVGAKDFGSRTALEAELAKTLTPAEVQAKVNALNGAAPVGKFGRKELEIGGRMYQVTGTDAAGNPTYRAINKDAIPGRDVTQDSTKGWDDEWDYGRTGNADLFADHYKLAARDPVRLHQDMIDGPQKKLADLKAKGGSSQDIADAQKQVDTLKGQWDLMRGKVYGVDDQAVSALAATVPEEQAAAFTAQAERCCTPAQLQKLATAYQNGDQVDPSLVNGVSALVPKDQQAAFEADMKGVFTQEQLQKLVGAYNKGHRKDGKWISAKASGEDTMLGD